MAFKIWALPRLVGGFSPYLVYLNCVSVGCSPSSRSCVAENVYPQNRQIPCVPVASHTCLMRGSCQSGANSQPVTQGCFLTGEAQAACSAVFGVKIIQVKMCVSSATQGKTSLGAACHRLGGLGPGGSLFLQLKDRCHRTCKNGVDGLDWTAMKSIFTHR